ncbi:MAG: hypothetical protein REI94_05845 [Moraxellaceae bacterium]|nr:hypothetical protein [Moraxellaceae bacterium]
MTENWERLFDLTLEPSTYVHYLGDDDGLLPGALECADRVIKKHQCSVLNWEKAEYAWPDIVASAYRNYASVRLSSSVEEVCTAPFLASAHAMETSYSAGPSIYSSFIQLPILRKIRQSAQGRFFRSCSPDVFSSYAIAASIDRFTRCSFALSVNGASGNSNGIAYIHQFQSDASAQFRASRPIHPSLVHAPSVCIAEADGLLTARDALPGLFGQHSFNFLRLFARLEEEAAGASPERRSLLRAAIHEICDKNGLAKPSVPDHIENTSAAIQPGPVFGYAPSSSHLTVDFARIGIENVADACRAIAMLNPLEALPHDGNGAASPVTTLPKISIFRRIARKVVSHL